MYRTILDGVSANGSSDPFTFKRGDRKSLILSGVPDGATVTLEINSPSFETLWAPVEGGVFTNVTGAFIMAPANEADIFRATVSNASGSTDLNLEVSE